MISDLKIDYAYGINYELSNKKLITGFIKKKFASVIVTFLKILNVENSN